MGTSHQLIPLMLLLVPGLARAELDCPVGTSVQHREAGTITHQWCAFGDGTRHGPSIRIDEDGFILEEGSWEMGLRHGQWQRFVPSGERTASGSYSQGERVGTWTNYDPDTEWMLGRYFDVLQPPEIPRPPVPGDGWLWWSLDLTEAPIRLVPVGKTLLIQSAVDVLGVELSSGEPLFQIPLQDRPKADLVIDQLRVGFVTDDSGVTIADLEQGKLLQIMSSMAVTGVIALEEDVLVIRDRSGAVSAVDIEQGRRLWISKGPWGRVGPIFVSGMLVGVQDRYVHQIDPETGLRGWRTRLGARLVELVPGFNGEHLFALDKNGGLYALDLATGTLLWSNEEIVLEEVVRGALLRDDQDALVVYNGTEFLRVDHASGALLDRVGVDPEEARSADLMGQLLCTQGPQQGLVCEDIHGVFSWSLDLGAEAVPPLILDRLLFSLQEDNTLLAIDRLGARVSGDVDSDIELQFKEIDLILSPEWVGDEMNGAWTGEQVSASWLEARDRADECGSRRVSLDLSLLGEEGDQPLVGREALILELELESEDLESEVELLEPWTLEYLEESWVIDLLAEWSPQIVAMEPFSEEGGFSELQEAMYSCELDSLEFQGSVEVQDGLIRRRYDGSISIRRVPDLDPLQGCLVELRAGDEDLGMWSTPLEGGRVWLRLAGMDEPPLESLEALVDGENIALQGDGIDELEIWFGNSGEPWVPLSMNNSGLHWNGEALALDLAEAGSIPLMISELSWPDVEDQGFKQWEFDARAVLSVPNAQGLLPLLEVSGCMDEDSTQ